MQKSETNLPGVWELRPKVLGDARGFFLETYHQARFAEFGVRAVFVQDNHSSSVKNTLRGFHYQLHRAQAKVCRVVEGEALDVALDIRIGSPTFGKWASVVLSAEKHNEIFIPAGFAHGFLALSERVQFLYKCSDFYDAKDEHGIAWNAPEVGVEWGIANPIVSDKDSKNPRLSEVPRELLPRYLPE